MNKPSYNKKLFFIGIVAAVLGCIADILLLYHPDGNYHLGDYQFFNGISKERIIWGYYLGILFIGFELLGFREICKALYPNHPSKAKLFLGALAFLFLLGIVYHAVVTFLGVIVKTSEQDLDILETYRLLYQPLEILMGTCLVFITLLLSIRIWKGKTLFPKWVIAFNPAFIYALLILLYVALPLIGNVLIVAGFNLSNGIFIAICWWALSKKLHE